MGLSEYIETVTEQMRCKRAHAMVAKELENHIVDQKQAYIKEGMEESRAEAEAVRQMGDAVEVGALMDHIHRPRMDKRMLVLIGIFSVAAVFIQNMVFRAQGSDGFLFGDGRSDTLFPVLLGLLIMTGILFLDYTWLGKKPVVVWAVLLIGLPVVIILGREDTLPLPDVRMLERFSRYVIYGVMLPAYGGMIYHYRKRGWLGLFFCLAWLGGAAYFNMVSGGGFFFLAMNVFACLLLLTYAAAKGWFGIPRIPSLLSLWLLIASWVGGLFWYVMNFGAAYQADRLRALLSGEGADYITGNMRKILGNLRFLGRGEAMNGIWENSFPWESATSFLLVAQRLGVLAAILVIAGLAVLFVVMATGIARQKSVLGGLIGTACLLGLLVPAVCHILCNLTLLPYVDAYIPFLYPGWIVNAGCYTLLGLYLSVYRNTDVVA